MNSQKYSMTSRCTPTETRAKIVKLALSIIGEDKEVLTDLLTHKTTPNGGAAITGELKYTNKSGLYSPRDRGLADLRLSNSPVGTRSTSPQPSFGMFLLLRTFPVAWVKRRGLISSNPALLSRQNKIIDTCVL